MFKHDDTLKLLQKQLEQLLAQREILDRQISGIKQSIAGLALYQGPALVVEGSLTGLLEILLGSLKRFVTC